MNNLSIYDELDQVIDQMLAAPEAALVDRESSVGELAELASELRHLPRDNFKMRLRLELEWEVAGRLVSATADADRRIGRAADPVRGASPVLPSLFGKTWAGYPVRRINFALSVALHAVMAFLLGAGFLMVKSAVPRIDDHPGVTVRLEPYPLPVGSREKHGGGSGGAAEKVRSSKGTAPQAAREQLTPPIVLRNNERPKLVAATTVITPPDISLPRTHQIGDPLSDLTKPSNGPGVGGGLGGRTGDGIGSGRGPGRGAGENGGCCDGPYAIGNGVSMPRAIYAPEPEFSEEARRIKYQGEVTLLATIGSDGHTRNLTVVHSLGMGLDEKALEAVRIWRFDPAKKDGRPVAVQMQIIVNFHLF